MKFASAYQNKRQSKKIISSHSHVKQSFKDECDINNIMRKYTKTGLVTHVTKHMGDYSDLVDVPTYQDALNKVLDANESFETLPSSVRKRFNNDPAEFINFVGDPTNEDEMRSLGLLPNLPVQEEPPVPPGEEVPAVAEG